MKAKETKQGMMVMAVALLLALGLVLAGCNNGSTDGGGGDGDKKKDTVSKITGQTVYVRSTGAPSTANGKVYLALLDYTDPAHPTEGSKEVGSIANGKLTFTLPATIEEKYLTGTDAMSPQPGTFGPESPNSEHPDYTLTRTITHTTPLVFNPASGRKGGSGSLYYKDNGNGQDVYLYYNRSDDTSKNPYSYEGMSYIYVSGDITVNGKVTIVEKREYTSPVFTDTDTETNTYTNFKLSKGWNSIYQKTTVNSPPSNGNTGTSTFDRTYSTTAPTGLKWETNL